MRTALIALGANQGDELVTIAEAEGLIAEFPGFHSVDPSKFYRTAPIGVRAGTAFVNAVLAARTSIHPQGILTRLRAVEDRLGRDRSVKWGPRIIDLDLIGVDDLIVNSRRLKLPHPECWYRRFVLDPLCEVASSWRHPMFGMTAAALKQRLEVRPLPICLETGAKALADALNDRFDGSIAIHFTQGTSSRGCLYLGSDSPSRFVLDIARLPAEEVVQRILAALDVPRAIDP